MRPILPLHFAGSPHSSRTATPEQDSRASTPDSVRTSASTEASVQHAASTIEDLRQRGVISQTEYDALNGGMERAHLEVRNKTRLARDWQRNSTYLDSALVQAWQNCHETEEHLGTVQEAYILMQQSRNKHREELERYRGLNRELAGETARLRHNVALTRLAQAKPKAVKAESSGSSSRVNKTEPAKTLPKKSSLRHLLLDYNLQQAKKDKEKMDASIAQIAKEAERQEAAKKAD